MRVQLGLFVSKVISFFFTPAQDSSLIKQSALLLLFLVNLLPLWEIWPARAIGPAAAHHSILQDSRLMPEQVLILCARRANVEAHLGLIDG